MSHPTVSSEDLICTRKVSVESCKDSMPNFASEPHPGFKSASRRAFWKYFETSWLRVCGCCIPILIIIALSDTMWQLMEGRCWFATLLLGDVVRHQNQYSRYQDKPLWAHTTPPPPPFALSFLCGVWFTLPWQFCLKKALWWTKKTPHPDRWTPPPRHIPAIWTPMVPLLRAPLPRCVSLHLRREFASGARLRKPSHLGEIGGRKDDGGGRGRSGLGCQEFFPTKMRSHFSEWVMTTFSCLDSRFVG